MNYQQLSVLYPTIKIQYNDALSNYTYTKTGGKADVTVFPKTVDEVKTIVDWARNEDVALTILGNASNLIVRDGGIRGIVMILTDLDSVTKTEAGYIVADSGARLIDVSYCALTEQLTGLEFACGIPGSIGGAVYMNAGAYGGEVKEVITSVDVITREGEFKTYTNEACDFSYRHSIFQSNDDIILTVTFQLVDGEPIAIKEDMMHFTDLRESKQPLEYPSCGSVFKRPVGYYTGKLIQDAGLQGKQIGGVQVSTKHAGFMVNVDEGTATDYIELIQYVQAAIKEKFNVILETEVRVIGEK